MCKMLSVKCKRIRLILVCIGQRLIRQRFCYYRNINKDADGRSYGEKRKSDISFVQKCMQFMGLCVTASHIKRKEHNILSKKKKGNESLYLPKLSKYEIKKRMHLQEMLKR